MSFGDAGGNEAMRKTARFGKMLSIQLAGLHTFRHYEICIIVMQNPWLWPILRIMVAMSARLSNGEGVIIAAIMMTILVIAPGLVITFAEKIN
jgi:hypothetical protein